MNTENYYDLVEFKESNDSFEEFLSRCTYVHKEKVPQVPFKISTMTISGNFCDGTNPTMIYQRLYLDEDIAYIEFTKNVRGSKDKKKPKYKKKDKKKKSTDKRKKGKGSPFSNQLSIGFKCENCEHTHNNPICVKLFQNGKIHMTGCKNLEEVKTIYNKLYEKIVNIKTEYTLGGKSITINCVTKIKKHDDVNFHVEMVNGTFKTNYKIDLTKLYSKLTEIYTDEDIFINCEKKTQLVCYLKKYKFMNVKKQKEKTPSVFIYNSGSINIIAISLELLMKSYKLISEFVDEHFEDLVEAEIVYDETFFTQD